MISEDSNVRWMIRGFLMNFDDSERLALAAVQSHWIEAVYGDYPTNASGAVSFCSAALMVSPWYALDLRIDGSFHNETLKIYDFSLNFVVFMPWGSGFFLYPSVSYSVNGNSSYCLGKKQIFCQTL